MKIPHEALNKDTLRSLLEEIVSRDGTDYGVTELSLEQKLSRALSLLDSGEAYIDFDPGTETCALMAARRQ